MTNKNRIEFLEAKILALENENQHLKSLYKQQVMFGIKMTEMIAEMDSLLEKKKTEIESLSRRLFIPPPCSKLSEEFQENVLQEIHEKELQKKNLHNITTKCETDIGAQAGCEDSTNKYVNSLEAESQPETEQGLDKHIQKTFRNGEELLGNSQKYQLTVIERKLKDVGSDLLWQFLLGLLLDRDQEYIKWTGPDWEFYLHDREVVAKLWGVHKRRKTMTYDNMARTLRFYYTKGILSKCEEKFTYRFDDKHLTAFLEDTDFFI